MINIVRQNNTDKIRLQNTIKILIFSFFFLLGAHANAQGEVKKKQEPQKTVEAEGIFDTVFLLGEGLWFEVKKRLNLVDEKEIKEKEKQSVKVKVGKITTRLSVNNLFDKHYISESATNKFANPGDTTWNGVNVKNRVFFGWGRSWNFSVKLRF